MHPSVVEKLEAISVRRDELSGLLSDPAVISDQDRFRTLAKELSGIQPVTDCYQRYRNALDAVESTREMLGDSDPAIRDLAREELGEAEAARVAVEAELRSLLVPVDPADDGNTFLEIRAGAGGVEAALFAGDILRMYLRYAEARRWSVEVMSASQSEQGGVPGGGGPRGRPARVLTPQVRVGRASGCSGCRRPSRRAGSTHPRAPSRSCPRSRT